MIAAARTYRVLISVTLANMLQYRAVMLLWAAWGIVAPMVSLAVWTAVARGRSLAGYDRAELAGYFLVTMVISHLTTAWDMEVFAARAENDIPLGRGGRPEEIVGAALYLAGDAASFTTGATITVDGGVANTVP